MLAMHRITALLLALLLAFGGNAYAQEETALPPQAQDEEAPSSTPEPTAEPTQAPTAVPTDEPAQAPTKAPTKAPTAEPTQEPTKAPTAEPTQEPTEVPTAEPTQEPTEAPTAEPTQAPTEAPTEAPTAAPTTEPTAKPTQAPQPTPWIPQGQAYVTLADGTQMDGSLQAILSQMAERGEGGTVYLLTMEAIRITGVHRAFLEGVHFAADRNTFNDPDMIYAVDVQATEQDGQTIARIQLTATEKNAATAAPETTPTTEPTLEPTIEPTTEPTAEPAATPEPALNISVSARDYRPGEWSNAMPVFTLSGIPEGDRAHMYGVFICDERLVVLSQGRNTYSPEQSGSVSLRFVILDTMGDLVSVSDQYDMLLDFTPPDEPYIMRLEYTDTVVQIGMWDDLSGVEAISMDFGTTWQMPADPQYLMGEKDGKIYEGQILLRDAAGNVSKNELEHKFAPQVSRYYGGYGQKRIKHVPQTLDYSTVNYNALELKFAEGLHTTLTAGDTALALSLAGEDKEEMAFSAQLIAWPGGDGEKKDTLVLTAESAQGMNVWQFTGDVYKLLYNSGVAYMVFRSGDAIAVLPTAGFTGGTAYGKLKASGVSTRKFAYTLCQEEALMETILSVTVEGETYLLDEDESQPMYRYDVLVGDKSLMDKPYESYINPDDDADKDE